MRGYDCACGEYLEAENDQKLLEQMQRHTESEHQGEFSETQLRTMRDQGAYDVRSESDAQTF